LFFTTEASSSEPSWNFTPSRTTNVHSSYESFGVIDFARLGTVSPSLFTTESVS
jgi:hypothetical protein